MGSYRCQAPWHADSLGITSVKEHRVWVTEKENLKEKFQKLDDGTTAESPQKTVWKILWCAGPSSLFNKDCDRDTGAPLEAAGFLFIDTCSYAYGTFLKIAVSSHFEIKYRDSFC